MQREKEPRKNARKKEKKGGSIERGEKKWRKKATR